MRSEVNFRMVFPSRNQSSEFDQPGEETFDLPSPPVSAKRTSVLALAPIPAARRDEFDFERLLQFQGERVAVVGLVPDQSFREPPSGDAFEDFRDERDFRGRSGVDGDSERKTMAVDHYHPLRAFSALGLANSAAPFFAAAKLPSMKASSHWILPRLSRSSSSAARIFVSVPSRLHFWNRLWHVARGGYLGGRSPQGAPVRRIQRMPLSTSRGSRYGRPRPSWRTFYLGKNGARIPHCLSVRSIRPVDHKTLFRLNLQHPDPLSPLLMYGYAKGFMRCALAISNGRTMVLDFTFWIS